MFENDFATTNKVLKTNARKSLNTFRVPSAVPTPLFICFKTRCSPVDTEIGTEPYTVVQLDSC